MFRLPNVNILDKKRIFFAKNKQKSKYVVKQVLASKTLINAHNKGRRNLYICIYYKHSLAFKLLNNHYLKECMNFEISFRDETCNFISLYCSPSQLSDTSEDFAENFEFNLDNIANKSPYLLVVLGDFDVKLLNWYKHDKKLMKVLKLMQ